MARGTQEKPTYGEERHSIWADIQPSFRELRSNARLVHVLLTEQSFCGKHVSRACSRSWRRC